MPATIVPAGADNELFQVAEVLLRDAGPHALSLRQIAVRAGTSTQAVYTSFGGKPGLIDALFRAGYSRLADRLAAVDTDLEPIQMIAELSLAYRDNALANPHLYDVMTGRPLPEYDPPAASRAFARSTLHPLIDAVTAAVDEGDFEGEPEQIAHVLWAAAHGFVSLIIHGLDVGDGADTRYRAMTRHLIDSYRTIVPESGRPEDRRSEG